MDISIAVFGMEQLLIPLTWVGLMSLHFAFLECISGMDLGTVSIGGRANGSAAGFGTLFL